MESGTTFEHQMQLRKELNPPYDPVDALDNYENVFPRPSSGTGATLVPGNIYYTFPDNVGIARGIITSISISNNTAQAIYQFNTIYQASWYITLVNVQGEKVIERMPAIDCVFGSNIVFGGTTYTNRYPRTFWLENIDMGKSYMECVRAFSTTGQNPALPLPGFFYLRIGYRTPSK